MFEIIFFILIGMKLDMMNGLYLALIILSIIVWFIKSVCNVCNLVMKYKKD